MKDRELPDNKEVNQAKDPNLQGGPDIDTTHMDRPSALQREGEDMVGEDRAEWGELVLSEEMLTEPGVIDPSGDDPFVPNTPELRDEMVGSEHLMSERDRKTARKQHEDPTGEHGPEYEKNQGLTDSSDGGSTDPHDVLTHDSSGYVDREWRVRADVDPSGDKN